MFVLSQKPFESVEEIYKEELTETMVESLTNSLQGKRDMDVLILSLFECILFKMTVRHTDPETVDNCNDEYVYEMSSFKKIVCDQMCACAVRVIICLLMASVMCAW